MMEISGRSSNGSGSSKGTRVGESGSLFICEKVGLRRYGGWKVNLIREPIIARIDNWGRWPVILVWMFATVVSFPLVALAFELESSGAELAAGVAVFGLLMLLAGAMVVTWRRLTGGKEEE